MHGLSSVVDVISDSNSYSSLIVIRINSCLKIAGCGYNYAKHQLLFRSTFCFIRPSLSHSLRLSRSPSFLPSLPLSLPLCLCLCMSASVSVTLFLYNSVCTTYYNSIRARLPACLFSCSSDTTSLVVCLPIRFIASDITKLWVFDHWTRRRCSSHVTCRWS